MKSRLAILGMLVAGMLFSTAGAGLAIQGGTQSARTPRSSQYATPTPTADAGLHADADRTPRPTPRWRPGHPVGHLR